MTDQKNPKGARGRSALRALALAMAHCGAEVSEDAVVQRFPELADASF